MGVFDCPKCGHSIERDWNGVLGIMLRGCLRSQNSAPLAPQFWGEPNSSPPESPLSPHVHYHWGEALEAKGLSSEAVSLYQKAIELEADFALASPL